MSTRRFAKNRFVSPEKPEGSPYQAFELASSTTSRTGVVLVNYRLKPAA